MDIAEVMDQVAARLRTIEELAGRTHASPPDSITPPAAVVIYPESITFDATYGRGLDRLVLPLLIVVGRPSDRTVRDRLARFVEGAGPSSVKQVLESGRYTALDVLHVVDAAFDVATYQGTDYLGALFTLNIAGPGSP